MPGHDLIVIGASAGGVEALTTLVAGLPPDLPAAVCVVVHLRPFGESHLATVLSRLGPLPAFAARHGEPLRAGAIYVGVPDLHLLVERGGERGVLRLSRGPRENRVRPAVDPLFRSAALAFGPRVVGVVLSGALDDGTAGLWSIHDRGGITVVQDPADALVTSMPRSAIDEAGADHVVPARDMGRLLGELARLPVVAVPPSSAGEHAGDDAADLEREVALAEIDEATHQRDERDGRPSRFPCPDCGGVLWDVSGEGPLRFRCETGHAYSQDTLAEEQTEVTEAALWAALRALEDRIAFARMRAEHAEQRGLAESLVARLSVDADAAQQHAAALRALLRLDGRTSLRPQAEPDAARWSDDDAATASAGAGAPHPGAD